MECRLLQLSPVLCMPARICGADLQEVWRQAGQASQLAQLTQVCSILACLDIPCDCVIFPAAPKPLFKAVMQHCLSRLSLGACCCCCVPAVGAAACSALAESIAWHDLAQPAAE